MPLPIEDYIVIAQSSPEVLSFAAEWHLDQQTGGGDLELHLRFSRVCNDHPDSAVSVLIAFAEQASDQAEKSEVAECIEWFLIRHGQTHWETLNGLCRKLPRFREAMAIVLGSSLSNDLRRKVEMWKT